MATALNRTSANPWKLKTPPGTAEFLVAIALAATATSSSHAQIEGVVTTGTVALPAASVELWAKAERVAVATVDARGRFSFTASQLASASLLVVQHVGYRTAFHRIHHLTSPMAIRLEVSPPVLPDVVVAAKPVCPNREDPVARALWGGMQSHYLQLPPGAQVATGFFTYESVVPASELGHIATPPGKGYSVRSGQVGGQRLSIERSGYARPLTSGTSMSSEFDSWAYAPLGSLTAYHFVDVAFGRTHTFSLLESPPDEVRIAFCSATTRSPRIEGELRLRSDSSLALARWRFLVPERDESAQGEAVFPPIASQKVFLQPVSSMFWRKHRMPGQFYQRLERYGIWRVGTSEDVVALIAEWHRTHESKR